MNKTRKKERTEQRKMILNKQETKSKTNKIKAAMS